MRELIRKILLSELNIPNPVYGASGYDEISSGYGMREHPSTGEEKMHNGFDIAVPCGTVLKAPDNGTVTDAGFYNDNCGGTIEINHGSYSTRYCHLKKIQAKEGEKIFKGERIGKTGGKEGEKGSGVSTGCHLHMEVKINGELQDPENHVKLNSSPDRTDKDFIYAEKNDTDTNVKYLNCFLKNTTYGLTLNWGSDDLGEFTSKTEDAVKKLQNDLGIEETGKIDKTMIPLIKDKVQDLDPVRKELIQSCISSS